MDRYTNILPQISRFFSAKNIRHRLNLATSIVITLSFISVIVINVMLAKKYTNFSELPGIYSTPFSPSAHFELASMFKRIHDTARMENEIILIQDLMRLNVNVLGDSTDISDTIRSWYEQPKQMEMELDFWNKVLSKYPDYRDAYLQAAYVATQLNREKTAKILLDRAKQIDPSLK